MVLTITTYTIIMFVYSHDGNGGDAGEPRKPGGV